MTIWSGCYAVGRWRETAKLKSCLLPVIASLFCWTQACYENYFCPAGTGNPLTGQMADDAVNRGLSVEQANPFLNVDTLKYLGDEVDALTGCNRRMVLGLH